MMLIMLITSTALQSLRTFDNGWAMPPKPRQAFHSWIG